MFFSTQIVFALSHRMAVLQLIQFNFIQLYFILKQNTNEQGV